MSKLLFLAIPATIGALVGAVLLSRRKPETAKPKHGAFVEEFEILPPPPPPFPAAPLPLTGLTFAVKDIFDIEGRVTGFGNPTWLSTHEAAQETAPCVALAVAAGAKCVGKTEMDEMAYSIFGQNIHYGSPLNPSYPLCLPGGSSSGSAVAVAANYVDFAIGTDTGGSVRVPAAFCGVFGYRPSHGAVDMRGCVPMAPSFDTVGCFARSDSVLRSVVHVLLQIPYGPLRAPHKVVVATDLFGFSEDGNKDALMRVLGGASNHLLSTPAESISLGAYLRPLLPSLGTFWEGAVAEGGEGDPGRTTLLALRNAFRALQGFEFQQCHGEWVTSAKPSLAPDIKARVDAALRCERGPADVAKQVMTEMRAAMDALLKDDVLLALPTSSGPPPPLCSKPATLNEYRDRASTILTVGGMSGCPQVSIPLATDKDAPAVVSLMARYGADPFLLDAVTVFARQMKEDWQKGAAEHKGEAKVTANGNATDGGPPAEAVQAKDKGNVAYEAGRFEDAVKFYSKAIDLDPSESKYFSNRAMAHLQLCHFEDANADCSTALSLDRRNVKAMLRRAHAREFLGQFAESLADFEQALVYEPRNKIALESKARLKQSGMA